MDIHTLSKDKCHEEGTLNIFITEDNNELTYQ